MKERVSLITLGVSDYERATSFYATLGWSPALEIDETVFYQANGAVRDLDGHAWEIAHNPGFGLAADGSVLLGERA